MKENLNLGSAHIIIDLTNRILTVKHGTPPHQTLFQRKAKKGTWDNIWKTIRGGIDEKDN